MTNKKRRKIKKKPYKPQGKMYTGSLPSGFKLQLAANFGTEEPFVVRVQLEIPDILKSIKLNDEEEVMFRFDRVVELLDIARVHLFRIEDKNFDKQPTFDQQAEYNAFYNAIWWSYKDRFQPFMKELGFDIGFIFTDKSSKFESGAEKFIKDHPNTQQFIDSARNDRATWQNILALHRNTMHTGDRRKEKHDANNPKDARVIFDNVWQAIEEHFVSLAEEIMDDGWTIVQIPEHQRDKTIPKRFMSYPKGLLDGTIKLPGLH